MINVFRPLHPSGFLSCSDRRLRLDSPGDGAEANKRHFFHATAVAMPRHASMAAPNVDAHAVPSLPLLEYRNPLPYETSLYLQIMSMWVSIRSSRNLARHCPYHLKERIPGAPPPANVVIPALLVTSQSPPAAEPPGCAKLMCH